MPTRVSMEEVRQRIPSHITLDESTYRGVKVKCRFVDEKYGEFFAVPTDVFKNHGHRKRGNEKLKEQWSAKWRGKLEKIKDKFPSHSRIREETFCGMNVECLFVDEKYGEFVATPKAVINNKVHRQRALDEKRSVTITKDEFIALLPSHIKLVEETFVNMSVKALFIDEKYGEFWKKPTTVRRGVAHGKRKSEKTKKTCLEKYGKAHYSQVPEIQSKMKRSMRQSVILTHWKTGEEVICVGSYEKIVVEWLNKEKIEFDWQIPFDCFDEKTYYIDLYLPDRDLYVEIKGWWRQEISKKKWEWFHEKHPNSALWSTEEMDTIKETGAFPKNKG